MDTDLKCNRLTCRRPLSNKAVVTTCSHIFCIECANELFNASRLCPACETTLTEPDDVVLCSLQPTNDYKTSVLSGLTPSIILEICSRAISFWQYQIHQENSFQQAVVRNVNDKNAQLQKQLENVVREANGEINILNNKKAELERDVELERRKVRELQDASREQNKEYLKLKIQHDKIKRKALLAPNTTSAGNVGHENGHTLGGPLHVHPDDARLNSRAFLGTNIGNNVDLGAVVGGMEANGIQRTPIVARTGGGQFLPSPQRNNGWAQQQQNVGQTHGRITSHRQHFTTTGTDRSYRSGDTSDRSGSANEVENMLINNPPRRPNISHSSWATVPTQTRSAQVFPMPSTNRRNGFRPAGVAR